MHPGTAIAHLFFLPVTYSVLFHRNHQFSYAEQGEDWEGECREGKHQSPIHIITKKAIHIPDAQPLVFINYDIESMKVEVMNHTLRFSVIENIKKLTIGIAGGGLKGVYKLDHIHIHWSSSEHAIDHHSYKMEAHFVHFKQPPEGQSQDDTIDEPDGIAVLAVLYEWGDPDLIMDKVILDLGRNGTETELAFTPRDFLPNNTQDYVRYRGSLTTPPCSEVVIWTVFTTPKMVAQYQVNWLRVRKLRDGHAVAENYRPLQRVNNRKVYLMEATYESNKVDYNVPGSLPAGGSSAGWNSPELALTTAAIVLTICRQW